MINLDRLSRPAQSKSVSSSVALYVKASTSVIVLSLMLFGGPSLKAGPEESRVIDLSGYVVSFDETFRALSVSAWGPGTRWIAHTPWNGDFGDAQFADPTPEFPFKITDRGLQIEASKGPDGKWRSGLLASNGPQNEGFSQQFGYFEMRAKLPAGPGLWPAFWLVGNQGQDTSAEIDVMEHYGVSPGNFQYAIHTWPKVAGAQNFQAIFTQPVPTGSLYTEFHNFGVSVEPDWTIFYYDRHEIGRSQTREEHRRSMFLILDLGLGSGWPIDKAPSPSFMEVAYVRAYQKRER